MDGIVPARSEKEQCLTNRSRIFFSGSARPIRLRNRRMRGGGCQKIFTHARPVFHRVYLKEIAEGAGLLVVS